MLTDYKGEAAKNDSVCGSGVSLTSKSQMQTVSAGKHHSSNTGGSCSSPSTHTIDHEI